MKNSLGISSPHLGRPRLPQMALTLQSGKGCLLDKPVAHRPRRLAAALLGSSLADALEESSRCTANLVVERISQFKMRIHRAFVSDV